MGFVGALLVAVCAKGFIVDTGKVLLDREMDHPVVDEIREVVEAGEHKGGTQITDLHVWRVGKEVFSCVLTLVTRDRSSSRDLTDYCMKIMAELRTLHLPVLDQAKVICIGSITKAMTCCQCNIKEKERLGLHMPNIPRVVHHCSMTHHEPCHASRLQ